MFFYCCSLYRWACLIRQSFVTHYAPKVRIFDSALDPNVYYKEARLLFWTVVAIGARKYSKNPTLLSQLGPRVVELAQLAVFRRDDTSFTLVAYLLLCIWSMPVDTMFKDISPILAGAMLSLAVTTGLHVHGVEQDISRTTLCDDNRLRIFRAKLWMASLTASQTCSYSQRQGDAEQSLHITVP